MKLYLSFIIVIISVAEIMLGTEKKLPSNFTRCKRSNPNCLQGAVSEAIGLLKVGFAEFGIPSIDPLAVDSLLSQGSMYLVNVQHEFTNISIHHLADSIISEYVPNLDKYRITATAITPRIEMLGDYVIDGRDIEPLMKRKGKTNITLIDLTTKHELIGEPYKTNGTVYMQLKQFNIKLLPKRIHMHFDNVYNGNRVLADKRNDFLNANWELMFNELKGGYEDSFGLIFKEIANKIFARVPMSSIFSYSD